MIYLKLIWAYIKIGIFGFGGGYAMLSLVEHSVVDPGWISETMFTDIVAISQMTPGPIGINSATYIGYVAPGAVEPSLAGSPLWGLLGSVACTLAVVVPSFLMVLYGSPFHRRTQGERNYKGHIHRAASGSRRADSLCRNTSHELSEFLPHRTAPGVDNQRGDMCGGVCSGVFSPSARPSQGEAPPHSGNNNGRLGRFPYIWTLRKQNMTKPSSGFSGSCRCSHA